MERSSSPTAGPAPMPSPSAASSTKLAANIAMGRKFAGIHWRTDYSEAVRLGEAIAARMERQILDPGASLALPQVLDAGVVEQELECPGTGAHRQAADRRAGHAGLDVASHLIPPRRAEN